MSNSNNYFKGPSGVYFNSASNDVVIIERTGDEICSYGEGVIAYFYDLWIFSEQSNRPLCTRKVLIEDVEDYFVFLGRIDD